MKFNHDDEQVPTLYVVRNGDPVRINVADWDGKEPISAQSHFVPDGVTVEGVSETPKATGKGGGKQNTPKPVEPPPSPVKPTLVGTPKAWTGTDGSPIYTQAANDAKFYRVDDKGELLIADGFETDVLAATAVITPTA